MSTLNIERENYPYNSLNVEKFNLIFMMKVSF
jgi:hypothetical protein